MMVMSKFSAKYMERQRPIRSRDSRRSSSQNNSGVCQAFLVKDRPGAVESRLHKRTHSWSVALVGQKPCATRLLFGLIHVACCHVNCPEKG